jgi:hypothetical protein
MSEHPHQPQQFDPPRRNVHTDGSTRTDQSVRTTERPVSTEAEPTAGEGTETGGAGPRRGYVAIVDTYHPTRRLIPEFAKAGYECVRVQSGPEVPEAFRSALNLDDYADNIVHGGDLEETVRALAAYRPVAVVPGGEHGVEFADRLSERMGLASNGTEQSAARRDKYTMIETVKAAGVAGAAQLLVPDEESLRRWHERLGRRVVVKPLSSGGGDGVFFCDTPEQSAEAYRTLLGAEHIYGGHNEGVVAQEYLRGAEYIVDTVSRDGRHRVCDIWRTTRLSANGVLDLCDAIHSVPRSSRAGGVLAQYAESVLDALGIRHGPGHLEVKLTPEGPRLVEMGARIAGGEIPHYAELALGESQLGWTALAYADPERFHAECGREYQVRQHFASVAMISPVEGTLRRYRHLEKLQQLESLHDIRTLVAPGSPIRPTVNDLTYPLIVNLRHEVKETVLRDAGTVRYLDGESFYELED